MTKGKQNKQYLMTRYYQEGKPRETVIQMKKGISAISVVSLNPDHFITDEVQQDITQQLIKKKIHIEIIQETHIPRNLNYGKNGYRIITSSAIKNPKTTP